MQVLECSQFFSKINVTVMCCVTRGREGGRAGSREGGERREGGEGGILGSEGGMEGREGGEGGILGSKGLREGGRGEGGREGGI